MNGLSTGELAKQGGVNLESIRFYERERLLPKPPRTRSGYRVFSEESVRRVRFIKRTQELGFTLKEIKELLALRVDPATTCADIRERAEAKITDIDGKIRVLQAMKKVLKQMADTCPSRGPTSACSILESLNGIRR